MGKVTIKGRSGDIMLGHVPAASLGSWTITAEDSTCELTADVTTHNAFRMQQPSLTFRVSRQNARPWEWTVVSAAIVGSTLHAHLSQ